MIHIHDATHVWQQSQRTHPKLAVHAALIELLVSNGLHAIVAIVCRTGVVELSDMHTADPRKERGLRQWVDGTIANAIAKGAFDTIGTGTCILLSVYRDGEISVETWSAKKKECDRMDARVEKWIDPDIAAVPFRTLFGWGNDGVPQPLTRAEMASLNDNQRRYAQAAMIEEGMSV